MVLNLFFGLLAVELSQCISFMALFSQRRERTKDDDMLELKFVYSRNTVLQKDNEVLRQCLNWVEFLWVIGNVKLWERISKAKILSTV